MKAERQYITLKDMLTHIETGAVFSVEVVAFDKKRPLNNGRFLHYAACRLEKAESGKGDKGGAKYFETRNVRLYANGRPTSEIRKIHPLLVVKFNSRELIL